MIARLNADYDFLDESWAARLIRAYGTDAWAMMGAAKTLADMGEHFGATLTAGEVAWLMNKEYALSAEDVVWRRSKLGLRMDEAQIARLDEWMQMRAAKQAASAAE